MIITAVFELLQVCWLALCAKRHDAQINPNDDLTSASIVPFQRD
jgi:hypothetical protein